MSKLAAVFLLAAAACSSGSGASDAGPPNDGGGNVNPCLALTDGGGIGAACTSVDQCGGNPVDNVDCGDAIICATGACASAGGAAGSEAVSVQFSGSAIGPLPSYLQIYLLAPALVGSGTLTCGALLGGLDAGTLSPDDTTEVNQLFPTYEQSVDENPDGGATDSFALNSAATGANVVLYLEAYLDIGEPDGGARLLARNCATFNSTANGDGGTGSVSMMLNSQW